MKTPIARAKEFLITLQKVLNKAFLNGQLPESISTRKSNRKPIELFKDAKKKRDIFQAFYEQVTRLGFEETPCQCTLVSPTYTYLTTNKIPFNEVEVKCEYHTIIQLPVPKSKYVKEMKNLNVNQ